MGLDNCFFSESYGLMIWLVAYQAAAMLKSVLMSSPTLQFSLVQILHFPSGTSLIGKESPAFMW